MGISLWQCLSDRAETMARSALKDVVSLDDWKKKRPGLHDDFLRCLGLYPFPQRCDLKLTEYGETGGEGFHVRRVAFQLLPDCWTTAAIFYPDPAPPTPAPGVLYVCGHGPGGTYGYNSHAIMWARRGYVCLVVDTIEQNDNPGEHHGFMKGVWNSWLSMGYAASGGEMWNAVRALDVLAEDPMVDAERLAVTGLSGGGGCSFFLAVADERIKAVSTHCGISTPYDAIANRHLISHCPCMYPYHLFGRDTSVYAALIAPRATLFCFADDDPIFHIEEARLLNERAQRVYRLYGCEDRCELVTCPGGHGTHPQFVEATNKWFDRHVAGDDRPMIQRPDEKVPEPAITVFNGQPPEPNLTDILPRLLSPRGSVPLPGTPEEWPDIRKRALDTLLPIPGDDGPTAIKPSAVWRRGDGALTAHHGQISGMDVWLHVQTRGPSPAQLIMGVAGPGEGSMDLMGCVNEVKIEKTTAFAGFEGRLGGLSFAGIASKATNVVSEWSINKLLPFAFPLTGMTPVTMTVHDIGVALDYLRNMEEFKETEIYLYGKGDAGVAALYRGLLDERVAGVILEDAPSSHADSAPILGILRSFDMPQAVGLMAPRKVALIDPEHNCWTWSARAYDRLGCPERFIETGSLARALDAMLK